MTITGERIICKDYTPEDFERFFTLVSDPELKVILTP